MYFSKLQRAYMARDFVNNLFAQQGIIQPMVKVQKAIGGFRIVSTGKRPCVERNDNDMMLSDKKTRDTDD